MYLNPKYDYCFVRSKKWVEMCYFSKKMENMPSFLRVLPTELKNTPVVLPIGAAQILKKTGLTIQAHELIAGFPHSISTGNYKLSAYRRDFRVRGWPILSPMIDIISGV